MPGLPIAVEITPSDAPREHVTILLAACARASAEAECVPAADVPAGGSRAVALVTWHGDRRAVIEVGLRKDGRPSWRSRTLDFVRRDDPGERWRTVGFVVGTLSRPEVLVPDADVSSPGPASKAAVVGPRPDDARTEQEPEAGRSAAPPPRKKPAPPPKSPARKREVVRTEPPRQPERAERPSARSLPRRKVHAALDLGGVAGPALEGMRFGGLVRARFGILGPLGAAVAVRYLERPVGPESFGGRWVNGSAGLALHFGGDPLEISFSVDGRAEYFQARADDGRQQDQRGRVLPGAGIGVHAGWMPTDAVGVFLGVDGCAMFGTTDVFVRDELVTSDGSLRLSAEGGVRLPLW